MEKTVLIVEDEYLIAMDLKQMLERAGWRVIGPTATVSGALELIKHELPMVALLDVNLGAEMVGPVAEKLRAHAVPFVVASAYDAPEHFGGEVLVGAPNVGKPATKRKILDALAQVSLA